MHELAEWCPRPYKTPSWKRSMSRAGTLPGGLGGICQCGDCISYFTVAERKQREAHFSCLFRAGPRPVDSHYPHLGCSSPSRSARLRNAEACTGLCLLSDPVRLTVNVNPRRAAISTLEISKDLPERTCGRRREGTTHRTPRRELR